VGIFVHGAAVTPTSLLEALARRADFTDVKLLNQLLHKHDFGVFVEGLCAKF
jgi:hypothetical protein